MDEAQHNHAKAAEDDLPVVVSANLVNFLIWAYLQEKGKRKEHDRTTDASAVTMRRLSKRSASTPTLLGARPYEPSHRRQI